MKNKIKKSIDSIEFNNSQREEIYQKIVNKKFIEFKYIFKYSVAVFIIVFALFIVEKPISNENNIRMIQVNNLVVNNENYEVAYMEYVLGKRLEDVIYNGVTYEVYENELFEDSIVLYNEFYEVYLKIEE